VGSEDDVDPRRAPDDLGPVLLGEASTDGDLHTRRALLDRRQMPEVPVELVVGVLADGAGVEDDDVGRPVLGRTCVAGLFQQPGQPFGVVDVHLAPVGADLVRAHAHLGTSVRGERMGPERRRRARGESTQAVVSGS
jgi:hypothetical protein